MAKVEALIQELQMERENMQLQGKAKLQALIAQQRLKETQLAAKGRQKLLDIQTKGAEAGQRLQQAKAEAEAQGQPIELPLQPVPPPQTKALNGVSTDVDAEAISQAIAQNPASIQGGAAVQAGGGVQIPGLNQIPANLTSTRETTGTQFFQHDFGILPVETTTTERVTEPNALRPRDVLALQLQQVAQQQEAAQQERRLTALTNLELVQTYGKSIAGAGEALLKGDLKKFDLLTKGTPTLQAKATDAAIAANRARANYWNSKTLGMSPEAQPLSVRMGLRSPLVEGLTQNQLLQRISGAVDEDGMVKEGLEGNFAQAQVAAIDHNQLLIPSTTRGINQSVKAIPFSTVLQTAVAAASGDPNAIAALVRDENKLYQVSKDGTLEPSKDKDSHTRVVLQATLDLAERLAGPQAPRPEAPVVETPPAPASGARQAGARLGAAMGLSQSAQERAAQRAAYAQQLKQSAEDLRAVPEFIRGVFGGE